MHVFNSMGQVLHEWSKIANGTLFLYLLELFLTKCLENIKWWKVALPPWWFSVGTCKYKPGYKSYDLL